MRSIISSGLTSITIPNSVTSIGDYAFYGCSGLKTVINCSSLEVGYYANKVINAPNGSIEGDFVFGKPNGVNTLVAYIGNNEKLTLPANYKGENYVIGSYTFSNCSGLTSITIPNSVTSIEYRAFSGCSGLTSITIPNSVTSIGWGAFYGCSGLISITIPNSVTSIGDEVFRECGLTSITIPNSVTSIGTQAFYGCSGLISITIPNSVTSIGTQAFYGCSGLTNIEIPNSVTSIGDDAFSGCSGLTSITIPNSVTSIGNYAFYGCSGLISITIPNSVTSIGSGAFNGCTGLISITIPNSVTSIGSGAFNGCTGLTSVYLLGKIPPTVRSNSFTEVDYLFVTLYVPEGTLETYKAADTWKEFLNIQEFDVTGVDEIEDDVPVFEFTADGVALTNAIGKNVTIYTANGSQAVNITNYVGEEITLDKGLYIIVVNGKSVKAIVK